ncbi:erythromycin esterase family protein [Allokutzneria oryzae]|uniref:Erythromycin esterase family protein n=1 Tax=Allokutzneria oryzae TaxID=1378989 RepID=A0ABV5ZS18_9PSEU
MPSDGFTEYARANAIRLDTIDPAAPLEDLEPLRALVGDAKIVAIGENNHHVREFYLVRHRILRFLVERCGFDTLGFESGFAEGSAIDDWVRGGEGELTRLAKRNITFTLGEAEEMRALLTWMRETEHEVGFSGLDVPASAGSPRPALDAVAGYLGTVDPDAVTLVTAAITATELYSGPNSAVSSKLHKELDPALRHAATAALSRLLAHMESLRPAYVDRSSTSDFAVAAHHVLGAWRLDQYLQELSAMGDSPALFGLNSSRDSYMAASAKRLVDEGRRVVMAVHNGHLQRTPVSFGGPHVALLPAGCQLAHTYGDDYVAIAVTGGEGHTVALALDPEQPTGYRTYAAPLAPPEPGGVEAAMSGLELLDLRPARGKVEGPTSIRWATMQPETDVLSGFDAVVHVPTTSTTDHVPGR